MSLGRVMIRIGSKDGHNQPSTFATEGPDDIPAPLELEIHEERESWDVWLSIRAPKEIIMETLGDDPEHCGYLLSIDCRDLRDAAQMMVDIISRHIQPDID